MTLLGIIGTFLTSYTRARAESLGIELQDLVRVALRAYAGEDDNLVTGLETGSIPEDEFAAAFAERLSEVTPAPVDAGTVVDGLFSGMRLEDDMIDLEPLLRDAVVLALPFQPLCQDDCPGLCTECGARLADDPAAVFEALVPGGRVAKDAARVARAKGADDHMVHRRRVLQHRERDRLLLVLGHRADGIGQQAGAELAQDAVVEARVGQVQGQKVLPVDPRPNRVGRLPVGKALAELHQRDQCQAPWCVGGLAQGRVEVTKDGVIKQWAKPVAQEQVGIAVRKCRSGDDLRLRRNGWYRAMWAQGHGSYAYQRRPFNAP
mgnify:CR=1 FL=1